MYNKKISNYRNVFRGVSLALSVLTLSLAVSYFASAWTEPSVVPPGCVSGTPGCDAPINVSFTDQSKEGRIGIGGIFAPLYSLDIRDSIGLGTLRTTGGAILNTGGATTGLLVQNGNVGIGTTTPNAKLHVKGDNGTRGLLVEGTSVADAVTENANIFIQPKTATAEGNLVFVDGAGNKKSQIHTGNDVGCSVAMQFQTWNNGTFDFHQNPGTGPALPTGTGNAGGGKSRLFINSSGNVGIGTTSPSTKLDVRGDVSIGSGAAQADKALCWMADKTIGYCSTQPDATGSCTCNAIN